MVRKATLALLGAALAAPLAPATHAPQGPCDSGDAPSLGIVLVRGPTGGTWYLDDRNALFGEGVWLYEESNGIVVAGDPSHSLQRGASPPRAPTPPDRCVDDPRVVPDALVL